MVMKCESGKYGQNFEWHKLWPMAIGYGHLLKMFSMQ